MSNLSTGNYHRTAASDAAAKNINKPEVNLHDMDFLACAAASLGLDQEIVKKTLSSTKSGGSGGPASRRAGGAFGGKRGQGEIEMREPNVGLGAENMSHADRRRQLGDGVVNNSDPTPEDSSGSNCGRKVTSARMSQLLGSAVGGGMNLDGGANPLAGAVMKVHRSKQQQQQPDQGGASSRGKRAREDSMMAEEEEESKFSGIKSQHAIVRQRVNDQPSEAKAEATGAEGDEQPLKLDPSNAAGSTAVAERESTASSAPKKLGGGGGDRLSLLSSLNKKKKKGKR